MKPLAGRFRVLSILILTLFFALFFTIPLLAEETQIKRLEGTNRYQTAVAISQEGWSASSYVVLARGDDFADALCAGPLAAKYQAPILMSGTHDISRDTLREIERLGVKHVLIVGGKGVISEKVENILRAAGINDIRRLAGENRYETSVKIAEEIGGGSIVLTTGKIPADALSISVPAAQLKMPILLAGVGDLPPSVKQYLQKTSVNRTYIVGGPGAVSENVEQLVPNPIRLSGSDRYKTNIAVIEHFENLMSFGQIFIAQDGGSKGQSFADALAGSVLAAKANSPLILAGKAWPSAMTNYFRSKIDIISQVTGLGGEDTVPHSVLQRAANLQVTEPGELAVSPGKIIAAERETILLTYTLGEKFTNGSIEFYFPKEMPAIEGGYRIWTKEGSQFFSGQVRDGGGKLIISGVTAGPGEKISLSLENQQLPKTGNYTFKVHADADGPNSERLPNTGLMNASGVLTVKRTLADAVQKQYLSRNRPRQALQPRGFVIHSTASPGSSAQAVYRYFNTTYKQASAHYVVDWQEILQLIPEGEVAWHGGRKANNRYLSVEMCEPGGYNKEQFQEVWDHTVLLVADACVRYGWNATDHILSHNLVSRMYKETNHTDPLGYFARYNKSWQQFLDDVDQKIKEMKRK